MLIPSFILLQIWAALISNIVFRRYRGQPRRSCTYLYETLIDKSCGWVPSTRGAVCIGILVGEVQYKFFSSTHALRISLESHYKFIALRDFYDQSAMANIFKVRRSCFVYYTHVMMILQAPSSWFEKKQTFSIITFSHTTISPSWTNNHKCLLNWYSPEISGL